MRKEIEGLVDWLTSVKSATIDQIRDAGFSRDVFTTAYNKGLIFEPTADTFAVV